MAQFHPCSSSGYPLRACACWCKRLYLLFFKLLFFSQNQQIIFILVKFMENLFTSYYHIPSWRLNSKLLKSLILVHAVMSERAFMWRSLRNTTNKFYRCHDLCWHFHATLFTFWKSIEFVCFFFLIDLFDAIFTMCLYNRIKFWM